MRDDVARRVDGVRDKLEPGWSPVQVEASLSRFHRRLRRRRHARIGALGLGVALALCSGLSLLLSAPSSQMSQVSATLDSRSLGEREPAAPGVEPPTPVVELVDGSRAQALTPETRLVTAQMSEALVTVRLEAGAARFDVTRRPGRRFRVEAGEVTVEVHGTSFTVRREGSRARVTVHSGQVSVLWEGGERQLGLDEEGRFPLERHLGRERLRAPAPTAGPPGDQPSIGTDWRSLARGGRVEEAWRAMPQGANRLEITELNDVLLGADVARQAGHLGAAAELLRQGLSRHSGEPQAAVVAFTLGRLLLERMSSPAEAAIAFSRCRSLAPGGALSEGALAREVEAQARAGRPEAARQRALEYLTVYPEGVWTEAVRRHGALD